MHVDEFVPYLLILIAWHPDHPGEFDIRRSPVVFSAPDACEAAGSEYVAQRDIYRTEFGGKRFFYKCVQSASREEHEQAWKDLKESLAEPK